MNPEKPQARRQPGGKGGRPVEGARAPLPPRGSRRFPSPSRLAARPGYFYCVDTPDTRLGRRLRRPRRPGRAGRVGPHARPRAAGCAPGLEPGCPLGPRWLLRAGGAQRGCCGSRPGPGPLPGHAARGPGAPQPLYDGCARSTSSDRHRPSFDAVLYYYRRAGRLRAGARAARRLPGVRWPSLGWAGRSTSAPARG